MFVFLLLSSFLALVSADVYCSTIVPPHLVPSLESCDAALRALEQEDRRCGTGTIIFSQTTRAARSLRLPAMFMGSHPQYPMSDLICVISILWQPTDPRPVASFDIFAFSKILSAAHSIRDQCIKGSEQFHPRLGRAWIEPRECVDVQFGYVLGPSGLAVNASDVGSGNLTLRLADGSNRTFASSMLQQVGDCGAATGFENGLGANVLGTS